MTNIDLYQQGHTILAISPRRVIGVFGKWLYRAVSGLPPYCAYFTIATWRASPVPSPFQMRNPAVSGRHSQPIFTWVRLAQRIPVRIRIDEVPPEVFLSAGMTATVEIDPKARPPAK
jgi:hypothetical protein